MVVPSRKPVHARHRDGAHRRDDPRKAASRAWHLGRGLSAGLILGLGCAPAAADTFRVATYNAGLSRAGPGLLLRDIQGGDDPQVLAVLAMIAATDADVLVLTDIDYDLGLLALGALAEAMPGGYAHRLALRPNSGMATGLDLDGDGRRGGPRDAMGYGQFAGQGGLAVLSRLPIDHAAVRDFSGLLWRDLPGALLPPDMTEAARDLQRLSSTGHWEVPVILPDATRLSLLVWYATPPVFDGPEDRNGRRNHDETAFWLRLIDGDLAMPPPAPPFVVIGDANLDPLDGDGRSAAIRTLLAHPGLQDPEPRSRSRRMEPAHRGDPSLDTADYGSDGPGGLRVDYILPSSDLRVTDAGVLWPAPQDDMAETAATASRHRPVWVDLALPPP